MEDIIKINKLELASELANEATKNEMFSKGLIVDESEMYRDDNGCSIYTEKAQDIFNDYYDYFLTKIEEVACDEDENTIPESIQVGVYYYEDDETGKPVFDTDSMTDEFENKLKKLEDKFAS